MRISHKLILGFLVVALLIWLVGYLAVNTSQKTLQESIGECTVSLAVKVLDEIDRSIQTRIEEFQVYSKDLILQTNVLKSNQEFERLDNIQDYINEKDKKWTAAPKEEMTPFMRELINNGLSQELREKLEFYEEKYGHRVFGEVFVTNKYGANVGQTGKTTDYRQDDEEWWQKAKEDGLYVADVEYDRSAGVYSTDIGIRTDDEDGNFLGVMKVVLNIEEVVNLIKKTETTIKYDTTQFKLLTKDGKIIYSTEEFSFLEEIPGELLSCFKVKGEHTRYFVAKGDKPGEGEELFAHAHSKGYEDYKGLGWILIIEHKTEEIFAPVVKLRKNIFTISLAVTILAILLGFSISTSISKPIAKLRNAAAEIGRGNLDAPIEIKSNDEVGELADSFRKMAEDLKTSTTSIDELNKEILERQQAEEALEALNKELQTTVEKLSTTNRELEDFAHIIAHDLKTPLRAIGTLADWLSTDYADKFDDQGKEQVGLLVKRAKRMSNFIDSILQYSRLGRVEEEHVRVNLNELVTEAIDMAAPPENIKITIENTLPTLESEKTRILEVFQNLLSNAAKYMDKPKGRIRIGCAEQNGFWKFSVADNGCGIEEKHFEKIFRIFQTLSPRDESESTGIGLTVVKKIVELYGGKIWVESKPGKGSTFFFTLPKQGAPFCDALQNGTEKMGVTNAKLEANIVSRG